MNLQMQKKVVNADTVFLRSGTELKLCVTKDNYMAFQAPKAPSPHFS